MRSASVLVLCVAMVAAAGCSPAPASTPVEPTPPAPNEPSPGSQPTAFQYPTIGPAHTADPAAVGQKLLETSRLHWLTPPTPFLVENMSLAEARQRIPPMGSDGGGQWGPATPVWLVVFQGRWQLVPFDPSHANPTPTPYGGCVFVLFTDAGNELISLGDTSCPGKP